MYNVSQQEVEAILSAITREASAITFYSQLANEAPNPRHKNEIFHTLEDKKVHLNQFTNLYITLTGQQPAYQISDISIRSYGEGIQNAYQTEIEGYEEYQKSALSTQHPHIRTVFFQASKGEREHAARCVYLSRDIYQERKDYGGEPFVVDIEKATLQNNTYRTALWTGDKMQVTVMSIDVGDDIGLEVHPDTDQFIRIEQGQGLVQMGDEKDQLDFEAMAYDDYAIMIPAGKWHNITNTGNRPMKVYVLYAPPEHPFGTIHKTKADAMAAESNY
ncbi:cupin domain-containing protein [Fictibacillus nanhaiensis]|uniref:cupin domain-containing protein n=1 Tax=Fictibacillus nanhaiensis TaxID=742169 RepID=UPI001FEC621B|nr:cupin domain-containing protein [Fictibacillus nanhaiensis]